MDVQNLRCFCDINEVCGHRLKDGVKVAGLSTIAIALAFLITGLVLINTQDWENVGKDPVGASLFIFSLVAVFMSPYQIAISLLLLWQVYRTEGNIFICSVWYISHLNIMVVYFIIIVGTSVTCFLNGHMLSSYLIDLFILLYEVIFFYYCAIVNSFLNSLPQDRYL